MPGVGAYPHRIAVTYSGDGNGRNYRMLRGLCDRSGVAELHYGGYSVFPFDVTGPGDDLSRYRLIL